VFRVRGAEGQRPTVALFPADGDQWKSTAMSSIAGFLIDKLPKDIPVIF